MYTGKVIIAGAGPGDPELITYKAANYLQHADIVLTDRLVSPEIITQYVNPDAEIIYVGKERGSAKSTSQHKINQLIIEYFYQDKLIVRLKGGDVSIFSNILDELETLIANDIQYEIIPGITAASGAAAYSGIPLTARGYADAVRYLTYYKAEYKPDSYWKELAETDDTLVFYMSGEYLKELVINLVNNNISDDKAIAVISQATTPFQNVTIHQFNEVQRIQKNNFVSPTLIIIGKVVNLYERFQWRNNDRSATNYFQILEHTVTNLQTVY